MIREKQSWGGVHRDVLTEEGQWPPEGLLGPRKQGAERG